MRLDCNSLGPLARNTVNVGSYHSPAIWFRWFPLAYRHVQLKLTYSRAVASRFNAGRRATNKFEILYLAETDYLAQCEVRQLIGLPLSGAVVPSPFAPPLAGAPFRLVLQKVADLTSTMARTDLETSAQELTGDWQGYALRAAGSAVPGMSVSQPRGVPPTQLLGEALADASTACRTLEPDQFEGFVTMSAVVPTLRVLGIFPGNLRPGSGSFVEYDMGGTTHRIPGPASQGQTP